MEVTLRPYINFDSTLWLELTFELAVISSDCTAMRNLMLFTRLGLRDELAKCTVVQGRDLNCS